MTLQDLPWDTLKNICRHAEKEYPRECCGFLLSSETPHVSLKIEPIRNAQDDYHALDPQTFSRTSRSAYFMDPQELLQLHKRLRAAKEKICFIYHSHIDQPAHFSSEDQSMAADSKGPLYPEVDYLVISVIEGKAKTVNQYRWQSSKKTFSLTDSLALTIE